MQEPLDHAIEAQVEQLGYELVELERAGSRSRPILRLRIDRPDAVPGQGVSLDDCRLVSRALESFLEERREVPERYVLEVSSPGIERPLSRHRDFERFRGREVAVHGKVPLHRGAKKVEGELIGIEGEGEQERILLRTSDGEPLAVPRNQAKKVHLVYRWGVDRDS